ncbi:MAG: hypothetical protein K8I30_07730, partial [Anaerolineae bacterium]|nr:hypothetical protein [Anaerolineae bacterium]
MSSKFSPMMMALAAVMFLLLAGPVAAQDAPAPDPVNLAGRLLGFTGEPDIPMPSPLYEVGDQAQFWVSKAGQDQPVQITAELAGASTTAYIWVEAGTAYDADRMGTMAGQLEVLYDTFRIRDNYGRVNAVPQSPSDLNGLDLFSMPDVDNDPHLYIVYVNDLAGNRTTLYNPANSLATSYVPGGFSSEHEMVLVNMSSFPATVPLDDPAYVNILARQFYALVGYYNNPAQTAWLREAAGWNMLLQI